MAHTGAARAGVDNLTKSLAVEWGGDGGEPLDNPMFPNVDHGKMPAFTDV